MQQSPNYLKHVHEMFSRLRSIGEGIFIVFLLLLVICASRVANAKSDFKAFLQSRDALNAFVDAATADDLGEYSGAGWRPKVDEGFGYTIAVAPPGPAYQGDEVNSTVGVVKSSLEQLIRLIGAQICQPTEALPPSCPLISVQIGYTYWASGQDTIPAPSWPMTDQQVEELIAGPHGEMEAAANVHSGNISYQTNCRIYLPSNDRTGRILGRIWFTKPSTIGGTEITLKQLSFRCFAQALHIPWLSAIHPDDYDYYIQHSALLMRRIAVQIETKHLAIATLDDKRQAIFEAMEQ